MVPLFCHWRKVAGNDVNHFPSSSSKVKKEWSCTYTPPQYLHGKDRDKLQLLWFHDVCVCMFGIVPVSVVLILGGQFSTELEIGVVWLSVIFHYKHQLIV
jgi:hypothetical protein